MKTQREILLQRIVDRLSQRISRLEQIDRQLTRLRLALVLTTIVIGIAAQRAWGGYGWLLAVPGVIVFAAVVGRHRRLRAALARHVAYRALKQTHIARLNRAWPALPAPLPVSAEARLPIEIDLDLVGERSLHRLLDTAVSRAGSKRLRGWLNAGRPDPAAIARRQSLVAELRSRRRFRDRLTLAAGQAGGADSAATLVDWLRTAPQLTTMGRWLVALAGLAALNWLLVALDVFAGAPPLWQLSFLAYALVSVLPAVHVSRTFRDAAHMQDALQQLQYVFGRLEGETFPGAPALAALCAPLAGRRPTASLRRVRRIVAATGVIGNPVVGLLLNALGPWNVFFAWRWEQEKAALLEQLPRWIDVWTELEALGSLATFADLNPGTVLPVVAPATDDALSAVGLGHPLLPPATLVRNDFVLAEPGAIALITGSNMAGKSTFLRTVGINLVLAYAGGTVDAHALTVRPLTLFTAIQIADSVTDGISYFYAEVRRLKALLDAVAAAEDGAQPVLYFIDEIFRGTNNRERLIGSRSLIRALAAGRGIGLVSTHDLELVQLAETIPALRNYHFRDAVVDGKMVFDYRVHPGPCPTTNSLRIMALEGIPILVDG